MRLLLRLVGFGTVGGLLLACGGESANEPDAPAAMAGSPATAAGSGGSGSGGFGAGGTGNGDGGATASGGGGGSSSAQRCDGAFGPSQTRFDFKSTIASSLSITGDELELFFVDAQATLSLYNISVLTRSSKSVAFSEPILVSELQAACSEGDYPSLDVSDDGLRMYFTCLDGPAPLRFAKRARRNAVWIVDPEPIGTVGDSITVSGDELTATAVRNLSTDPRPEAYSRSMIFESLGSGSAVAGIDERFMNPDLSFDGRVLFGVIRVEERSRISFVSLGDDLAAKAPPSTEGMPAPPPGAMADDFTPTLTPDCRSMYFLRSTRTSDPSAFRYTLEYAAR